MTLCRVCGATLSPDDRYCPQCASPVEAGGRGSGEHAGIPPIIGRAWREGHLLFGKYRIRHLIGRGAMGVVLEAEDTFIGRPVAIKAVRFDSPTRSPDQDITAQRFLREAKAAGRLSHPHIVVIYEAGEVDGMSYIVMEYVDGVDLGTLIAQKGRLEPARAVALCADIAAALGYAHAQNIVHRDVKPANILVRQDGVVKVADFGIAKVTSDTSSLTRSGVVVGTPRYLSPEQIQGKGLDVRSDLFSLAAVFFETLFGEPPFVAESVYSLIFQILEAPYPTIDLGCPAATEAYRTFFDRSLAKEPTERYPNAEAFTEALRSLPVARADGQPLEPRLWRPSDDIDPGAFLIADEGTASISIDSLGDADVATQETHPLRAVTNGDAPSRVRVRRRWVPTAALVALTLLAGLLLSFSLRRAADRIDRTLPTRATATPRGVPPTPPGKASPASTSRAVAFVLPTRAAAPSPTPRPTRRPTVVVPPRPPLTRRPTARPTATPSPTPARGPQGWIHLRLHPIWAVAFLDGERIGEVPPGRRIRVRAGPHTLRLVNPPLGIEVERIVVVKADRTLDLLYNLDQGFLTVRTQGPARLFIDDRDAGQTPVERLPVPRGRHQIRLTREGALSWLGQVNIPPLGEVVVDRPFADRP